MQDVHCDKNLLYLRACQPHQRVQRGQEDPVKVE